MINKQSIFAGKAVTVDWEHYQINLSPKPSAASAKGGARPAMRMLAGPVTRLGAQLLDLALGLIPVVIAYLVTSASADSQAASETRLYLALASLVGLGLIQVPGRRQHLTARGDLVNQALSVAADHC